MSVFSGISKLSTTAAPTLKGFSDSAKGIGQAGRQAFLKLQSPAKALAGTKAAQHAIYPALVGSGIGAGSYAAMSGAGAGFRSFGTEGGKDAVGLMSGIVLVIVVLAVLVYLYGRIK